MPQICARHVKEFSAETHSIGEILQQAVRRRWRNVLVAQRITRRQRAASTNK
jgi:hypothetical protein